MNQMTKRIREDRSGFTLAELLIVVGILLVLMAIAIPVFTGALGKAEAAVASANARSAKSEALAEYAFASTTEQANFDKNYYYDEKGDPVAAEGSAKYGYNVKIAKNAAGDVVATVVQTKPEKAS